MKKIALFLFVMCGSSYGSEPLAPHVNYAPGSFNDRAIVLSLSHLKDINVQLIAYLKKRYPHTTTIKIDNLQDHQYLDYALAYAIISAFPHLREIEILNAEVRWQRTVELLEEWQKKDPKEKILNFTYTLLEEKMSESKELTKFFDTFEN